MIISLSNEKGGVGKTTIAINISSYLADTGCKVLFIDTDPRGIVVKLKALSENIDFDVIHFPERTLHKEIYKLSKAYTHTIIDTPPGRNNITSSALLISHLSIIPIEPSSLSFLTGVEIIPKIEWAQKYNKHLEGRLLISRRVSGTTIGREAKEILIPYEIEMFETEIFQRIDYVKSLTKGSSVIQYAPTGQAADEIIDLCDEIDFDAHSSIELLKDLKRNIDAYKLQVKNKRVKPRRVRLTSVDFVVNNRRYGGFIHNISSGGAFIETRESFKIGTGVTMVFLSPKDHKPIKVAGVVVRTGINGIGLKFIKKFKI